MQYLRYRRLLLIGLAISVLFLVVLLRQIPLEKSLQTLRRLQIQSIIVPGLLVFASVALRSWRWQRIFPLGNRPHFARCFNVFSIGSLANNILPSRAGDFVRCFLVTGQYSLEGAGLGVGTVALEKLLDGLALLFVVVVACLLPGLPVWLANLALISGLVLGSILVLLLSMRTSRFIVSASRVVRSVLPASFAEKIYAATLQFKDGLSAVTSFRQMTALSFATFLIWLVDALFISTLAWALDIRLSLPASVVVTAILGLGLMIPAAPGFIGTYEFFSVAALALFNIDKEEAFALTLLMHSCSFLGITILGTFSLGVSGIRLSQFVGRQSAA